VILIVDHDLAVVRIVGELLVRQSCRVLIAASAEDAVAVARLIRFDCVLTSTTLPDGTGEDLRTRFRRDPSLREVPFIFMTVCGSDLADLSAPEVAYPSAPRTAPSAC
jgi:CheY-like chemotaxis protein